MHRIEGIHRDRTTDINLFQNGPPGTKVTASWLNTIQEEICDVIEQAGIGIKTQASDVDHDQLYQAVTKMGIGGIPIATEMLMHQDVAPIGWSLITDLTNDEAVMVTIGSYAGGKIGGEAHPDGTWNAPAHVLTPEEMPTHTHDVAATWQNTWGPLEKQSRNFIPIYRAFWIETFAPEILSTLVGANNSHQHGANTWRPAAQCVILCRKEEYYL